MTAPWRARDPYLRIGIGLGEVDVQPRRPRIHMREDFGAKIGRWIVEESDRQLHPVGMPIFGGHHGYALARDLEAGDDRRQPIKRCVIDRVDFRRHVRRGNELVTSQRSGNANGIIGHDVFPRIGGERPSNLQSEPAVLFCPERAPLPRQSLSRCGARGRPRTGRARRGATACRPGSSARRLLKCTLFGTL